MKPATAGHPPKQHSEQNENSAIPFITLGKSLAEELKVKKGDTLLYMLFSNEFNFSISRIPTMKRFIVEGTTDSGYEEYDKSAAFIRIDDARQILGSKTDAITGIEVK